MYLDVSAWYYYPKNRTLRNVNRIFYNCGGYALGTLSWYMPFEDEIEHLKVEELIDEYQFDSANEIMVKNILRDFPNLTIISDHEICDKNFDYHKYEVIAFRFSQEDSNDWDFHFKKLGANHCWYEKMGGSHVFNRTNFYSIFGLWNNRYDSKITFFIRPRE